MSNVQKTLIREYANAVAEVVTTKTMRAMQQYKQTLSGDDSELANAWDDICIQVQEQESFFWESYLDMMRPHIRWFLEKLPERDRAALWLQTDSGWHWHWDIENPDEEEQREQRLRATPSVPYDLDEIVEYVMHEHVLRRAENYTNQRIRAYQEREQLIHYELERDY